jgi:N-glycosylase/DNA lyase
MEGEAGIERKEMKNFQNNRKRFRIEEDEVIKDLVEMKGMTDWHKISGYLKNRSAKQCKERYNNYLAPEIENIAWTEEEDELLRSKIFEMGKRWTEFRKYFPNRGSNNIKNRWHKILCHQSWAKELSKESSNANKIAHYIPNPCSNTNSNSMSPVQNDDLKVLTDFQNLTDFYDPFNLSLIADDFLLHKDWFFD